MSGWSQVPTARAIFPCLGIEYGLVEISALVDLVITGSQFSFELMELIQTNNSPREGFGPMSEAIHKMITAPISEAYWMRLYPRLIQTMPVSEAISSNISPF